MSKMLFTLYVQMKNGRQIRHPKGIHNVSIDSNAGFVYAFSGKNVIVVPLKVFDVLFHCDGIRVRGLEYRTQEHYEYQEWWLTDACTVEDAHENISGIKG